MKVSVCLILLMILLSPGLLYAGAVYVPSNLSDLNSDSTHRIVTDADKASWNALVTKISNYAANGGVAFYAGACPPPQAFLDAASALGFNTTTQIVCGNIPSYIALSGVAVTMNISAIGTPSSSIATGSVGSASVTGNVSAIVTPSSGLVRAVVYLADASAIGSPSSSISSGAGATSVAVNMNIGAIGTPSSTLVRAVVFSGDASAIGQPTSSIASGSGSGTAVSDDFNRTATAWSSATAYNANDVVTAGNSNWTYIAKQSNTNHNPNTDTTETYWTPYMGNANWTKVSGTPKMTSICTASSPSPVRSICNGAETAGSAAYWSANTFNNNQYSEVLKKTNAFVTNGSTDYTGPTVRTSSSQMTFYMAHIYTYDDFGGTRYDVLMLMKCVNGTWTQIGTDYNFADADVDRVIRIEANGTTITAKWATTHGGTYTTVKTVTDSAISSGSAGIVFWVAGMDYLRNWYGGDL